MSSNFFQIQDGLSQRTREFPELVKSFFSMDSMSEKSILELMKKYARENGSPHFFDNVNLSKVVAMMNNEADGETDPAVALYAVWGVFAKILTNFLIDESIFITIKFSRNKNGTRKATMLL